MVVWSNGAVVQNYWWTPKWVENTTSVHLHHSHLPLKVTNTVLHITSGPLSSCYVQYIFYIWRLWFCYQNLCELSVQGVLKLTVWRLSSDHKETQLYLQLATSRVTECTAVLVTVIHLIYCTLKHKWSCVSMQCEHSLVKATLLHLVLQLYDILTCIYQVIKTVKLEVLL